MAESIQSFVSKLQAEGVQAGREEAEKIKSDAEKEAEEIVRKAREEAEKIRSDAKAEGEEMLARSRTELELAARDSAMKLRETLIGALQEVLKAPVEAQLSDEGFLKQLIHDVSVQYAACEREGGASVSVNLNPDMAKKLADWAIQEIRRAMESRDARIDLHGSLKQAGFEYRISGGTIEVTRESVVETLSQLISPSLREVLQKAMSGQESSGQNQDSGK